MLLSSWMVVCILLEDIIMVPTFPYIKLPHFVECIPSVDHAMMETDAPQMIPALMVHVSVLVYALLLQINVKQMSLAILLLEIVFTRM